MTSSVVLEHITTTIQTNMKASKVLETIWISAVDIRRERRPRGRV